MSRTRALPLAAAILLLAPAAASGAELTTGVLHNASGAPAAGEVRVYAFQLPRGEGAREMPLLGTAQSGPDGAFTVTAPDDAQLIELARPRGGWLDLAAVATTPGSEAQWGFTVFVDGSAHVSDADSVTTRAGVATVAGAHARRPRIELRADRPVPFALASQLGKCDTKLRSRKPVSERKLAVVGELNNAYNDGTRGKFTYAREGTAETAFGIAANVKGSVWSISGESTITDKGSISFPRALKRYSRKLRTGFEFTKYETQSSSCARWVTEVRATSWLGGTDSTIKQDGLDACDTTKIRSYTPDAKFSRSTGAATRYTRSVEAFGINLTSRSGFSNNVTLDYAFGGPPGKDHYICGPDGQQSAFEAGRVFAGSRK